MDDGQKLPSAGIFIWAAIGVVTFWIINLAYGLSLQEQDRGTFGDMFGAVNALFSGFALAGIIYAIYMQRMEVRLTKEDLTRTKEIFEKQASSLELQNKETKKQLFESTFFQLLKVFTQLTDNLDLGEQRTSQGKDVLTIFEKRLKNAENGLREATGKPPTYQQIYQKMYEQNQNDLGHYFRTLYMVLKFVDGSDADDKKFYTNILRAQLSNSELHLLLYNGQSEHGSKKLKPLLERYAIFDNLPLTQIAYPKALTGYSESAFGGNYTIKNYLLNQLLA